MTEKRLAEIEKRWTYGLFDADDLKQLFAEVRRLREELAVAEKGFAGAVEDLCVAVAYAGASS